MTAIQKYLVAAIVSAVLTALVHVSWLAASFLAGVKIAGVWGPITVLGLLGVTCMMIARAGHTDADKALAKRNAQYAGQPPTPPSRGGFTSMRMRNSAMEIFKAALEELELLKSKAFHPDDYTALCTLVVKLQEAAAGALEHERGKDALDDVRRRMDEDLEIERIRARARELGYELRSDLPCSPSLPQMREAFELMLTRKTGRGVREAFKKLNIHPEIAYRLNTEQREVLRRELGYELRSDLPCSPSLPQMREAFELMLTRKTGRGVREAFPNSMSVLKEWPRQHLDNLLTEMADSIYHAQVVKRADAAAKKANSALPDVRTSGNITSTAEDRFGISSKQYHAVLRAIAARIGVELKPYFGVITPAGVSANLAELVNAATLSEELVKEFPHGLGFMHNKWPQERYARFVEELAHLLTQRAFLAAKEREDANKATTPSPEQAILESNDRELLKKAFDAQNAALRRAYALIDLILKKPTDLLVVLHTAAQLRDETRAVLGMDDQVLETFHMVQSAEKDITEFKKQHTVKKVGDLLKWTEGLILQLPENHDGRNTWLLNHGRGEEAVKLRRKHPDGHKIRVSRFALMPGTAFSKGALLELLSSALQNGLKPASWDLDMTHMETLREMLGLAPDQSLPRTLLDLPMYVCPDRSFPIELNCVPLNLSQ